MGFADLHIHTNYSWDGTCTVPATLKKAGEVGLDVIAITDHDEIDGALEARALASEYGLDVIPGSEVSTADGHLLALFIHEHIPARLSLAQTLQHVGQQGGLAIAAHPSARGVNSLKPQTIKQALADPDLGRILVGIEVFNSGLFHLGSNTSAQKLADSLPVAQVGNSDSHLLWLIGNGATQFEGKTTQELRRALEAHQTQAVKRALYPRMRIVRDWVSHYMLRKAGWITGNTGPNAPLEWVRIA